MRDSDIPSALIDLAEPPMTLELLRKQAAAFPHTWEVAFDLLRSINLYDMSAALVQELLAYAAFQGGMEHAAWLSGRPRNDVEPAKVKALRCGDTIDIVLYRPEARNAVDRIMRDALYEAFAVAALDPEVTCVRLCSTGKAFCVGADLNEFGTTRDPAMAHAIRMQTLPALAIIGCAHKFEAHG